MSRTPIVGEAAACPERVTLYRFSKENYLFLPAAWSVDGLYLHTPYKAALRLKPEKGEAVAFENDTVTSLLSPDTTVAVEMADKIDPLEIQVMQGSQIPCLFLQTDSGSVTEIHKYKAAREAGQCVMLSPEGRTLYSGGMSELRCRGNNTFRYLKKPYQFKLDQRADLLGSGAAKTWVLLADYVDISLLRNRITLDMARYAGMRYAVASQSVDLYINGNYRGVYLLTEKIEIDSSRVDIHNPTAEMEFLNPQALDSYRTFSQELEDGSKVGGYLLDAEPQDLTGGYLLEIDKAYRIRNNDNSYVFTARGMGIKVDEPQVVGKAQILYLGEILNAFDRAFRQPDGKDPLTGWHYADLFDEDSLALKFLLEEVCQNYDAKAGSQYFYKDSSRVDPKVYAGPGWDYDLSYGNLLRYTPKWGYLTRMDVEFVWYANLYRKQPVFRQRVAELYQERFRGAIQILTGDIPSPEPLLLRSVAEYQSEISQSAKMNFTRWRSYSIKGYHFNTGRTFEKSVAYLQTFLKQRLVCLDGLFPAATPKNP